MKKTDFWKEFWNQNDIIHKEHPQEKVGRTIEGIAISDAIWFPTLDFLESQLELNENDLLLDIAAGSGMLSIPFSKKVKHVTAIDISEKLLSNISEPNVTKIVADVNEYDFEGEHFQKIVLYFALQHFTWEECVPLFKKIYNWLAPNGIAYIGDIPDMNRLFEFHSKKEWQAAYFESLEQNKPILGTWFTQEFLQKLGYYVGFTTVELIEQPEEQLNSHYRFDIKLVK